ncbi:MAG: hypothetical protein V1756_01295 [Patescibacteria group bacterium]
MANGIDDNLREYMQKRLEKEREKTEEEIERLYTEKRAISPPVDEIRDRCDSSCEAKALIETRINDAYVYLKKINRRLDQVKAGTISAKCSCGLGIKKILRKNPLHEFCVKCQRKINHPH